MTLTSLQQRITQRLPQLTPSQIRMADYVLANPLQVMSTPIKQLSQSTGFSVASATRFAAALGFSSYAEFREELARSLASVTAPLDKLRPLDTGKKKSVKELMLTSLHADAELLSDTIRGLDEQACELAVTTLEKASRVYVYGAGQSAYLANMFANDLVATGLDALSVTDLGGGWTSASKLIRSSASDAVVLISFRRYAKDTILIAERLAQRGIPLIAVTDGPMSPLARFASVCLFARSEKSLGKISSKAVELALLEALILSLSARSKKRASSLVQQADFGLPWLFEQQAHEDTPHSKPRKD